MFAPGFLSPDNEGNAPVKPDEKILRIMCPSLQCRRVLAVPESARGRTVKCKSCGATVRIPVKATTATPVKDAPESEGGGEVKAA